MKLLNTFTCLVLFLIVLFVIITTSFITASSSSVVQRGTWSDTVRDLISATQDDLAYRKTVLQELLSSSAQDNSFADAVCSRPEIMRCIGSGGDNKGSANSESWPVEITIRKFNGTIKWDKLPHATQSLIVVDHPTPVDVTDLLAKVPNGIESIKFIRCSLTTTTSSSGGTLNSNSASDDGTNANNNKKSSETNSLATLTSISFEFCRLDNRVLDSSWIPTAALRHFTMSRCSFAATSIAPLLVGATEIETITVVSNKAPIRFRELLVELVVRTSLKSIDFQAGIPSKGDELLSEMSFPRNLEKLRLCNMSLKSVPHALPSGLKMLSLPYNALHGKCADLSETALEEVDFSNNTIEEYPTKLPQTLQRLRLPSNKLRGSIDFTSLPRQLLEINVAHNDLSGSVDLTKLPPRLETIDIAYNRFSGPINMREFPDSVRYVFLQHNKFTGRYDVARLPLMSMKVLFGGNDWDSLIPRH